MSSKRLQRLLALGSAALVPLLAQGQTSIRPAAEVHRYRIEVAGLPVGTMTATRQPQTGTDVLYTLVSDVQVNFLVYHLKVYYKGVNHVRNGQLLLSTVDAHTNQGNFASRTEWKGNHYDIVANQYKHQYHGTETKPITWTMTDLFFAEPVGHKVAYTEYFGDYFGLTLAGRNGYHAHRDGREDEYRYVAGHLTTIIKKNPLKNFIIRRLP